MDINTVLKIDFVKALVSNVCGDEVDLVVRDNSFAVRSNTETERDIHRVILLPPKGFTANAPDQMNSHDEADYATIAVKGAIKEDKQGFSKLRNCLLVASKNENGTVSELNQPYLTYDLEEGDQFGLTLKKHSAGTAPFPVVKNNGFGFYHNLVNLTDEWLALQLHKRLRPQKAVDLEPYLKEIPKDSAVALKKLYEAIVEHGDGIFEQTPELVQEVLNLPLNNSLPVLGEMLYVHDSGMHEACTAFGVILKIGNKHPETVTNFLDSALKTQSIPSYYAQQLIAKIDKHMKPQERILKVG